MTRGTRVLRAAVIVAFGLAAASDDAHAQSAAQWSQLVSYVGRLANRLLEQQAQIERLTAENEQQRQTINVTIEALDQERCRISRLNQTVKEFAVQPPATPVYPEFVSNVACKDLASPVPPFPVPLAVPVRP